MLQCLVLELLVDLKHQLVAAWCNNTSAVRWAHHMTSSRSKIGHRLVQALMMRINVNEASPLVTVSVQGCCSNMADVASCSFKTLSTNFDTANLSFLQSFNSESPLKQSASW
jgi:hypothetical protein